MTSASNAEATANPVPLPPSAAALPARLGDFRIIREIGRGGMGIVYEAEQESLGRHVALKVLPAATLPSPQAIARFRREAQAAARLHHTNIVPVFGVGEEHGLHYYVMQYIHGRGLDSVLNSYRQAAASRRSEPAGTAVSVGDPAGCGKPGPEAAATELYTGSASDADTAFTVTISPAAADSFAAPLAGAQPGTLDYFRQVARIGRQVADALDYAHSQGTVHRDIKPANLLLDAHGTVWVTDFGLAKHVEQDDVTRPGEVAGTLRYLPPERFDGQSDGRGDIYSLGLTLYELLTLRPAFDGTDRTQLMRAVTQSDPPPPRRHVPAIPRDLETIILKATAREPGRRYQRAGEMAEDLQRFLEDRPILARRIGPLERLLRWCKRSPVVATLTALVVALSLVVAVLATVAYAQTSAALERQEQERQEAEMQRSRAEENVGLALQAFEELFATVAQRRPVPTFGPVEADDEDEPLPPVTVSPEMAALLQNVLKFYDQFAAANAHDPRIRKEAARAYRRVGDLHQRLGDWRQAEKAYEGALALYRQLSQESSHPTEFAREMAAVRNELGLTLQRARRFEAAQLEHRQVVADLQPLVETATASTGVRFELARAQAALGDLHSWIGQLADAENCYRLAQDLLESLTPELAANPVHRHLLARCRRRLATVLLLQGRRDEALQASRQAVAVLEQLVVEFPQVPDYRQELAEVLTTAAAGLRAARLVPEGEPWFRKALELTDAPEMGPLSEPQFVVSRSRGLLRLAASLRSQSRATEAESYDREAIRLLKGLVAQFPKIPTFKLSLADAWQSLGETLFALGQEVEGKAALQESVDLRRAYLDKAPAGRGERRYLAAQYHSLGEALRKLGQAAEADKAQRRAEELRKPGVPVGPGR